MNGNTTELIGLKDLNYGIIGSKINTMLGKKERWGDGEVWRRERDGRRGQILLFGKRNFGRKRRGKRI